ncbi:transcriptional repressor NrdR [Candidatus Dojkabacteria bacterium]|nr:transcriptional repressor NrdR [Candidatus Dojkabacteria bacterium]
MLCPFCKSKENKVVDKRDNDETSVTRRRRECLSCKKRFTTYERIQNISLMVEKRTGRLQEFDREKLKKGIKKAVKKRPITDEQIEELIDDIELRLLNRQTTEIKSTDIGKMVLTRLKRLDSVGYLLFASVYRDFDSIEDIKHEIEILENNKC